MAGLSLRKKIKIGHWEDKERGTGCTAILLPRGNVTSGVLLGSAPGTREFALLDPESKVEEVNAILLTGGSAMGLGASQGVAEYLKEEGIGYETPFGKVPIILAAVIFDLGVGEPDAYPTREDGYKAAKKAKSDLSEGNVGVGIGATVGKWRGFRYAMKGGFGISYILEDGIFVAAFSVVNSLGDILKRDGSVLSGARHPEGGFFGQKKGYLDFNRANAPRGNTTLSVVVTNVRLSKLETHTLARRASQGLIRTIRPVNTSYDGDIVFSVSLKEATGNPENIFERAQDVLGDSIRNAILKAKTLYGFPGLSS